MRKTSLILSLLCLFVINCKPAEEKKAADEKAVEQKVAEEHNAKNSLDYLGTYQGVLPCADCEGIQTIITLNPDESYQIKTTYLGKSEQTFDNVGSYDWMADGNRLIFEDIDSNMEYYFVSENKLTKLDDQGQKIEGPLAKNYELVKRQN